MTKTKKKLMILDGNALIHRSFHALPPTMSTKDGQVTNAIYGFVSVLIKAIREFGPEYVVLTLDKEGPTFRHEKFEDYKAQREKAPDDLYAQIPKVKEVARAFNIPTFEKEGFEADDLIGAITKKTGPEVEKIIVTGDLDTVQLVDKDTKVYTMSRGITESVLYSEPEVKNRFGLEPEKIIDFKALRGDPSDNIPGVPGIGEKTATDLLQKFNSLDELYKYVEEEGEKKDIKPRIVNLLLENKENAYLSRDLATIQTDVEIDFNLEDSKFGNFSKDEVYELFSKLEFKTLIPRLRDLGFMKEEDEKEDKFSRNNKSFNYILIDSDKDFKDFLKKLKQVKSFTFDTETTFAGPVEARLMGISFSWKKGEAFYINFKDEEFNKTTEAREENTLFNYGEKKDIKSGHERTKKWMEELKPVFEDEKIKKNGHNIKFDVRVVRNVGVDVLGVDFDTMLASYLLNPSSRQHGLDNLTFAELGFEKISKKDLIGEGRKKIQFSDVEKEKMSCYSCEDADFTERLKEPLIKQLKKNNLYNLFKDIEVPLIRVLAIMEDNGVKLDADALGSLEKEVEGRIKKLEKKIWDLAGENFNINSPQQLKKILFEKLEISTQGISKTKTGFSTAADELDKLRDKHKIIPFIQDHRELSKLLNTYIKSLPKLIAPKTGRIHTSFNQTITATGRLSSTDPNLQNIPVRTELGQKIRSAFTSPKGSKILSLDYSQIELRLAAHMSGDKKMIEAFKNNLDIHTATAAEINQVSMDKVTKEMRREAKAINFGILYGQGPHGLSQTADIPYKRAKEFIDKYFEVYSGIKDFVSDQVEKAKKDGYVETIFGRRRYVPEINSQVPVVQKGAERIAINTPLQGSNADIIKKAMIETEDLIEKKYAGKVKMIIQVHDELLFEAQNNILEEFAGRVRGVMKNIVKLKVPVVVDIEYGNNWGELKKIDL